MELWYRFDPTLVAKPQLLHDPRHPITVLGGGAPARSVLIRKSCKLFHTALSLLFFLQFATLESGEDSADVENSFE